MSSHLNKPTRSESRLRLRITNEKSENDEKPIETKELTSPSTEDSLADFKSPKLNSKVFQNDSIKILKDSSTRKNKNSKRKNGKNKINGDSKKGKSSGTEQSIESLFFRAQTEKSTFICPLCLKVFNDSNTQSIHTKNCAAKNNVSTRKLLAAVELQEKQKEERRAIGLPAGPLINPKKKLNPVKKLSPHNDPDIELALALSISLREVEKMEEFEEAVAVAAGSNEKILEMSSSQRKSTLQSFGFSSNKPICEASNINKKRRRKLLGPTVLQSRTQETRERILTERISEILVGSQSITQQNLEEKNSLNGKNAKFVGLENKELNKWYKRSADLWRQSQGQYRFSSYYVEALSKFIIPACDEDEEDDRNKGEILEIKEDDEEMKEIEEEPIMTQETNEKSHKLEEEEIIEINEDDEEMREIKDVDEETKQIEENNEEMEKNVEEPIMIQETNKNTLKKPNFDNSLKNAWSKMVDNSSLSDLRIFVKNDNCIHAHNLVIWTRCQALTNDYQVCDLQSGEDFESRGIKYKIHWPHIEYNAAIIFLNYVYCAEVSADILGNRKIRDQVKLLGEKYEMNELLEYLKDSDDQSLNDHQIASNEDNYTSEADNNRSSINCSPDLFDETEKFESMRETSIISLLPDKNKENEIEPSTITEKPETDICFENNLNIDFGEEKNISNVVESENIITNRTKSNLSIFIDKMNRRQARDILESDTDGDTPIKDLEIYKKNPFKIRGNADESLYSWKRKEIHKTAVTSDRFVHQNAKTPLTALEEEIRARALKNQFSTVNEDSPTTNSQDSVNSLEESMYTKYIKRRKAENSISEYREALKYLDSSGDEGNQLNTSIDSGSVILSSTCNNINERNEKFHDEVAGELFGSDFEISNSQEVSEKKRNSQNDKILEKVPDASSIPISDDENPENLGNFTQSKLEREIIGSGEFSDCDFEMSNSFGVPEEHKSSQNVYVDNNDEMQGDFRNFTQSKAERKIGEFSDSDCELSNPLVSNRNEFSQNIDEADNDDEMKENLGNLMQSKSERIIIVSSSEDEHCINSDKRNCLSQQDNLSSLEIPEEINGCRSFTQKLTPSPQKRENSRGSNRKTHEMSNDEVSNNERDSPLKKSQSKSFCNSQNRLKRRRVSSSFQISYDVTPPRDYDRMESPELIQELNGFGLKPQKRHRAVQLLQHIYNELHPSVPADMEIFKELSFNSETEEPPYKKKFMSDDLEKSISDKDSDEEMKSQVLEDVDPSQNSLQDIKEAFDKLLASNKQIYNKILTYEPLPLESLYENLINQGFKGKINEVISFLDDQCITFQVQEQNAKRRRKKKEKVFKHRDM